MDAFRLVLFVLRVLSQTSQNCTMHARAGQPLRVCLSTWDRSHTFHAASNTLCKEQILLPTFSPSRKTCHARQFKLSSAEQKDSSEALDIEKLDGNEILCRRYANKLKACMTEVCFRTLQGCLKKSVQGKVGRNEVLTVARALLSTSHPYLVDKLDYFLRKKTLLESLCFHMAQPDK